VCIHLTKVILLGETMSIEEDLAEIFKDKKENELEKHFLKPYIGWQCPLCFEVYNPLVLNCIKNHVIKRKRLDGRYNYPI